MAFFTRKTKLSDILNTNLQLVSIFPRLPICLGFGEQDAEQYCQAHHISTDFIVMVCNIYTFPHYMPTEEEINQVNLKETIDFLLESHRDYLTDKIPHIKQHLKNICAQYEPSLQKAVMQFFENYEDELQKHFDFEEKNIFPVLLDGGDNSKQALCLDIFDQNHNSIKEKMADLVNIITKYLPQHQGENEQICILEDLANIIADTSQHATLENKIIVPYIEQLNMMGYEKR